MAFKIRYKGLSDIRHMSAEDLKAAGVEDSLSEDGLMFRRENYWTQTTETMSDRLRDILETEGSYSIEEVNESGESVKKLAEGQVTDDTGNTVVDETTGQVSVKGEVGPAVDPVPTPDAPVPADAGDAEPNPGVKAKK